MTDCLDKRSYFDKSQSYCRWVDKASSDGVTISECKYRQTSYDFKVTILFPFIFFLFLISVDHDHDVGRGGDFHRSDQSVD
jgi:hypothetical protein